MDARAAQAVELMNRFAERTGVTGDRPSRRYLWTDAFAVMNLVELARVTGEPRHGELALQLVRRVHEVLGRHRPDDRRTGWLSGEAGPCHPTRGGLRIGKPLPERGPGEPLDPRLEWDRDGQYFHYLTRWMQALDQVARGLGESMFIDWARELAEVAHRAFVRRDGGRLSMVWKMSIDLTRPLVRTMGQHDPLDGMITCRQLDASAEAAGRRAALERQRDDFAAMIDAGRLATADPLAIGGLLADARRLDQLGGAPELVTGLLSAALMGLLEYLAGSDLRGPADRRLAFRELGLAIGLAAVTRISGDGRSSVLEQLRGYLPVREAIETFWLRPASRSTPCWAEHADINEVMLATCLVPDGYLEIGRPAAAREASPAIW